MKTREPLFRIGAFAVAAEDVSGGLSSGQPMLQASILSCRMKGCMLEYVTRRIKPSGE